ncbi:aminotransferase class I/II-fold pyridoxal phosphate-dependent enzyme [Streptomyces sp. NPDC058335]|uniref:aminotransferase class I/II-fold pyridoxal phosphate-dependent enzyme n=1 Tax=Streptomyces sp. NPDC058335 TaxID=3346451 RepID=UPI003646276A
MLHARSSNLRCGRTSAPISALSRTFRHVSARGKRAVYLLSNPHNPTGVVRTREELTSVASLAREYGGRVVADEVHALLVLPEPSEFTGRRIGL